MPTTMVAAFHRSDLRHEEFSGALMLPVRQDSLRSLGGIPPPKRGGGDVFHALTHFNSSARVPRMVKAKKSSSGSSGRGKASSKSQKRKPLTPLHPPQRGGVEMVDPRVQAQMKIYDEALGLFHQQKFQRAKQELEKVIEGPSKELADRARMHVKIAEQR